jgi:hypothetical protein
MGPDPFLSHVGKLLEQADADTLREGVPELA